MKHTSMTDEPDTSPPPESLAADVRCKYVTLDLADGYRGRARLFENEGRQAVLYLHGIQSHGGWFLRSCDYLRCAGMTVLAPDRRGSGLNGEQRGHCDSPNQLIEDVDRCVDWLLAYSRLEQVDIVSVSWSGKLALAYAHRHSRKVRSIAMVTPGLCARVDISLTEKIAVGAHGLMNPHRLHEIPLNKPKLFTTNPSMLSFIENDPLKLTHATASFFITSARLDRTIRRIADRIDIPVYLFLAEHDDIIDNTVTLELLKPVLTLSEHTKESWRIYEGASHTLDFEPAPTTFPADLVKVLNFDPTKMP